MSASGRERPSCDESHLASMPSNKAGAKSSSGYTVVVLGLLSMSLFLIIRISNLRTKRHSAEVHVQATSVPAVGANGHLFLP